MMEMLSVPEVARKATQQIADKLQIVVNEGMNLENLKIEWVNDLKDQGIKERLAHTLVNIAGERIKIDRPANRLNKTYTIG